VKPEVIVVGAGAAGIFAAWRAASLGAKVTLLEKTSRIGTKILVSGGGKCNITHAGAIEDVLRAFRAEEGRFLRPACYRFRNEQVVEMLTSRGLRVYTRPDGRIFPVDQTAKDVVAILKTYLDDVGVRVRLESPVSGLVCEDGQVSGVRYRSAIEARAWAEDEPKGYQAKTAKNLLREIGAVGIQVGGEERELRADAVILCPGGSSYPNSGTTGDGWSWAKEAGHRIEPLRAALAPIYFTDPDAEKSGVALRDISLKARQGKEIAKWRGDLLFTHQGVSGPAALGVSRAVAERSGGDLITLEVDLFPDQTMEQAAENLAAFVAKNPSRPVSAYLGEVPGRLVPAVMEAAQIPAELICARLDKKSRNRLANVVKSWPIGKVRGVPLEKGEVVAGGVSLEEVDPKTMESKLVKGLYLCGEILDIAGPVGGYNLQAAFASGYVAGESAVGKLSQ